MPDDDSSTRVETMIKRTDTFDARVAVPFGTGVEPRVRIAAIRIVGVHPFCPGGRVR